MLKHTDIFSSKPSWYVWALAAVLLVGAVVRFAYSQEVKDHPDYRTPMLDARYHDYWARALVTDDWTPPESQADPQIQTHSYVRPPLYPYFLSFVYRISGGSYHAPRIAQFALGLLSAAMGAWLACRWFGWVAGLVTASLMSLYWIFPYYESQMVEPSFIIPLLLAWVGITESGARAFGRGRLFASGILLGAIILGRPNALLLIPAIAAWLVWIGWSEKKTIRQVLAAAVLFVVGTIIPVSPAVIRNVSVSGEWIPVTAVGGQNLYLANNPLADGYTGIAPDIRNWSSFDHARLVRELGAQVGRPLTYKEASSEWTSRALDYMKENPSRVAALTLKKVLLLIGPKEVSVDREDEFERRDSQLLSALPGGFSWVLTGAVLSLLLLIDANGRRLFRRHDVMIVLITLIVFAGSYLPFTVTGRYRVPLIPLLLLLLSFGAQRLIVWGVSRSWKQLASWSVVGLVLFLFLRPNYAEYQPSEARWHVTRGLAYGRVGQTSVAADYLKRAIDLAPEYAYARLNYGVALARLEQPDDAIRELTESARLDPQALTWQTLGGLKKTQGDYEGAEQAFLEALRLSPSDATTYNDLGILYAEIGNINKAASFFKQAADADSAYFEAYRNLAVAMVQTGQGLESIPYYEQAAMLNPADGSVLYGLASQLGLAGRYQEAASCLYDAIEVEPENPEWLGALAWIRAAHPSAEMRNGNEALMLAERAMSCVEEDEPSARVVLAAAYAELGQFDRAVEVVNGAIPLAVKNNNHALEKTLLEHAAVYRAGKALRDEGMTAQP